MSNETLLTWLFPLVLMLLSLEELIFKSRFRQQSSLLPGGLLQIGLAQSAGTTTIVIKLVVLTSFTFLAAERGIYFFFLAFNTLFFLYLFLPLLRFLILRTYTPGSATALLLALPYSLLLFHQLTAQNLVTWKQVLSSIPAGFLLLPLVLVGYFFEDEGKPGTTELHSSLPAFLRTPGTS